ncbi:DUF5691 domain-containing protein [Neolewinella antarctica]|uniref:Uncharacterized protein n=1 Tax=Neolewinella antarctica TaxID=442734 RepID=A0ABX0XHR9_9BACT|nr:DUF5691 domain-containing protein [Neolewinella antarctica]NJC28429.1 hypothetical protein [Neolewinella antarctica]
MKLLQTLTLGTSRQPLSQEAKDYLDLRDAVDPSADDAEKALAAYALAERLDRLQTPTVTPPGASEPIAESRAAASPKLARALQLVFSETYADVLPEAVRVLDERGLLFPPHLLPELLDYAAGTELDAPLTAGRAVRAGGNRARWLATMNPAWMMLTQRVDFPDLWKTEQSPAGKRDVLSRWRNVAPEDARRALANWWPKQSPKNQETLLEAVRIKLSPDDLPWLRAQFGPKRKGVRRALLKLLLLGRDLTVSEEITNVAVRSLDERGKFIAALTDPADKDLLQRYGGLRSKESIGEFVLEALPPVTLPDLLGQTYAEYWAGLNKRELKAAAVAILDYEDADAGGEFLAFALRARRENLPLTELSQITKSLPTPLFNSVYHRLMDEEKDSFHSGSVAPLLAVLRDESWSERISKAFVLSLVAGLREGRSLPFGAARQQSELWKRAIPLVHVATFAFLRQHLHAMTERPDQFGKLSLEMLQTTAFRRVLYDESAK